MPNDTSLATARDFFVVVPFFNEAQSLPATLAALSSQEDRAFSLVLVDNGSTDESGHIAREFAAGAPFPTEVISESL